MRGNNLAGWIMALFATAVAAIIIAVAAWPKADLGPIAIMDDQGLCWLGTHGRILPHGAEIQSNGGTLEFHSPAMVFAFREHVSKKTVSKMLRTDLKHCVQVIKGK